LSYGEFLFKISRAIMFRYFSTFLSRTFSRHGVGLIVLLIGGQIAVRAETLQRYRENIESIREEISCLYSVDKDDFDKGWSEKDQAAAQSTFYDKAGKLLPPREVIEWSGGSVEVDNIWLSSRLDEIKKLAIDSPERDKAVDELDGRLDAVAAKLKEAEAAAAGTRSKDDEKQKLSQILKRPEYQEQQKPNEESALQRWGREFSEWINSFFPKPKPKPAETPDDPESVVSSSSGPGISPVIVQTLVVALALAVIAFVIWRVAPLLGFEGRRRKENKEKKERVILGERLAEDESSTTLFGQAEQMARDGNFRGAIRKGYIALLCDLGDRKIVRIAQHKTNRDYLHDVRKHEQLKHGVNNLTFMFENHWYGLSPASEEEWSAFRENYQRSMRAV
jgi:hypothetical protein